MTNSNHIAIQKISISILGSIFYKIVLRKNKIRQLVVFGLFNAFVSPVFAQNISIAGKVQDSTATPIASATISIKNTSGKILLFSFSDPQGNFTIKITDSLKKEELFLEVNILGYLKQRQKIVNTQLFYLFTLSATYDELEKVSVTGKQKIKSKGDTLSYDVKSFTLAEDRSIGDVIKHLPGMTVSEDGSISYNGKRVSNLLIHSDDLMDGRYGLATNSITKEMIRKIEVIQHYQPIITLKDKLYSDNIVVNLVLDNENAIKLSGQAQVGLGAPALVNTFINAILLSAKLKLLNSIKYNNNGEDYRVDLKDLRSTEDNRPKDLLSDAVVDNPGIPNKYIYRNNSFFTSLNNLYNTKDSFQIRANVRYFIDRNQLNYSSRTETYTIGDTIVYREMQDIHRAPHNFSASLNLLQNKSTYYFKDQFQVNLNGYENRSDLTYNANNFSQTLSLHLQNFSNFLQWIPNFVKRDVINFNWIVDYYTAPQNLQVGAGIDSGLLNNNTGYNGLNQFAEIPTLTNKLSVSYFVNNGRSLKQSYQLGIENQWQRLTSTLFLTQKNNNQTTYSGDVGNDLDWWQNKLFFNSNYLVKKEYWTVNLSVPLVLQQIKYSQDQYAINKDRFFFLITPECKAEYFINGEKAFSAYYKHSKNFGRVEDMYNGIIVTNYHQISSNEDFLRETRSDEFNLQYKMASSLKLFFFNIGVQYKNMLLNSALSTIFTNNIQRIIYVPLENRQSYLSYFSGVSKYIYPIKSKLGVNINYTMQKSNQYINKSLLPFIARSINLSFTADCKLFEFVSFDYFGSVNWLDSKQTNPQPGADQINSKVEIYNQNASLIFSPPKLPVFLTFQGRHQFNKNSVFSQNSYFFLDINLRCKAKKIHTDFEAEVNNLFDIKKFGNYYTTANQLVATEYGLRGRMFIVKAIFNF